MEAKSAHTSSADSKTSSLTGKDFWRASAADSSTAVQGESLFIISNVDFKSYWKFFNLLL